MEFFDNAWKLLQDRVFKPLEDQLWRPIRDALFPPVPGAPQDDAVRAKALQTAPIIWLLGKTGAGKTSIIKELTGADRAKIGEGFSPCTRTASVFDFPDGAPLVRFLDTRGLEEAGYDASEDVAFCANQAHFILVALRAMDPDQWSVVKVVRAARLRHPDWPVVVAQTALHQGYPLKANHAVPYPFASSDDSIPADLRAAISYQRNLFADLPGEGPVLFVALDFTLPEDGYTPVDYGLAELWDAIVGVAPHALAALRDTMRSGENDAISAGARSLVVSAMEVVPPGFG
jgi:predicted GTPase